MEAGGAREGGEVPGRQMSASVSLPIVRASPSPTRRMNRTMQDTSKRGLFSGSTSSAGPGTYGSALYISKLEQQLMGSKKAEDRMSSQLQRAEEAISAMRAKHERLRATGVEDQESAEERATRMALGRARRDLRSMDKKATAMEKTYQARVRLLEETVGDVQTMLTQKMGELKFLRDDHAYMQEKMEMHDIKRKLTKSDKAQWKEKLETTQKTCEEKVGGLEEERDRLAVELRELRAQVGHICWIRPTVWPAFWLAGWMAGASLLHLFSMCCWCADDDDGRRRRSASRRWSAS